MYVAAYVITVVLLGAIGGALVWLFLTGSRSWRE